MFSHLHCLLQLPSVIFLGLGWHMWLMWFTQWQRGVLIIALPSKQKEATGKAKALFAFVKQELLITCVSSIWQMCCDCSFFLLNIRVFSCTALIRDLGGKNRKFRKEYFFSSQKPTYLTYFQFSTSEETHSVSGL